ncbi:MAG: Gfo/Idh/MocA family oxidoreductase [Candidatus Marinimicrobia bacterium]|nr:Gfo/Idh/MocA family oxidoreductase [Candidatus Neomarinimicrobiota bacterium]
MHKTKLALVGAGTIGKRHLEAISQVEEAELMAIVDNQDQAESICKEMKVPFFNTTEEMLQTLKPEGVIVCTPTEIHLEPVLSSLNAGAHVLVEKPISSTMEEAQEIIKTAQTASREVLVGHHRRYYGTIQKTRKMIHDGVIGKLVGISGMWSTRKADSYYKPSWRQLRSSGPVLINLIHEIDTLRYICGEITSLSAKVANGLRDHPKEETVAVLMEFEGGALGTFFLSDAAPSPWTWEHATGENQNFPKSSQNVYRFTGSEGSLEFPNLVLWKHENGNSDWHQKMRPQQIDIELEDAYIAQCAHFCAVICGREEPRITASDATKTLESTLAVFDASENGMEVRF